MSIDRSSWPAAGRSVSPICNLQKSLLFSIDHWLTHTHSSLAEEALWRPATSGLGAAGAQLVVIFLFFHYGSVSSGCNRRAINQHYFHIAAPPAPAAKTSVASAALPPPAGRPALRGPRSAPGRSVGRRGNVIDRGAAMFVRRVAVRRRADPRDPTDDVATSG